MQNKAKQENNFWRAGLVLILILFFLGKEKLAGLFCETAKPNDCNCESDNNEISIPEGANEPFLAQSEIDVEAHEREEDLNLNEENLSFEQSYNPGTDTIQLKASRL